jgi:hypothetical protein
MCLPCGRDRAAPYVVVPGSLLLRLERFTASFEAVFGEADWDTTMQHLSDDSRQSFIQPGGTFLEPGVPNEDANWHNRGSLLSAYRALAEELRTAQILIFRPPLENPETLI